MDGWVYGLIFEKSLTFFEFGVYELIFVKNGQRKPKFAVNWGVLIHFLENLLQWPKSVKTGVVEPIFEEASQNKTIREIWFFCIYFP